jgi:hypothetical protein
LPRRKCLITFFDWSKRMPSNPLLDSFSGSIPTSSRWLPFCSVLRVPSTAQPPTTLWVWSAGIASTGFLFSLQNSF